ncbi:MAG: DNA photolyase, partial [candidate division KSB1 bacterium]|nr:DNA photolyase [candidate division KSB1 bacterium]
YANITDLFAELDKILSQHPHRFFRIGTGELADSLSLEHLTHLSSFLVPYFSKWPNAILELKTKSTLIDNLLNLEHRGRTVVSWSLNAESIAQTEEPRSPSVEERLVAARKCQEAGYKLGFHFDPLIHYPGWEQGYRNVVDKIFEYVDPESIAWISLGAFRYPPQLEAIIRQRHPQSPIVYGELFPGKDGKLRYFKPIRIEMFKRVLERIREYDKSVFVYLCMESPEVWRKVFGWVPEGKNKLSRLLDDRV